MRPHRLFPHAVLLATALLLAEALQPQAAGAATFTVNSAADAVDANPGDGQCDDGSGNCTLRAAIMEANARPGADSIILPAGTYVLAIDGANEDAGATGDLDITGGLTISGAGQANTIIDGGSLDRVFHIHGGTADLSDLTVRNGRASGVFPVGVGGGIYNRGGALTLSNSAITGNTAEEAGGGIRHETSDVTLTLVNSAVTGNTASGSGGGISNTFGTIVTLDDTIVSNNHAGHGGGIGNNGTLALTSSAVSGNIASGGSGGGINNGNYGTLVLKASAVSGNQATGGPGGGVNGGMSLTITDSAISGNAAARRGGGISSDGTLAITSTTVSGNTANDNGGGISNSSGGTMTVSNSTISGNRVLSGGGGGLHNSAEAMLTILNSTISGNQASEMGGGIFATGDSAVNVRNTIIAGNFTDVDSTGPDCDGNLNSQGYNLVGNTSDCAVSGDATGNITGQDPLLGPLQDNGGPTFTHALLPGSPAIDAGSCEDAEGSPIATDQRGTARPQGSACDIGAFELGTISKPGDQNDDGVVNVFDAIISLQIIVGLATPTADQRMAGDTVPDGELNVLDVVLTLRYAMGLVPAPG